MACLTQLSDAEKREFFDALLLCHQALEEYLKPQGFNIGMNLSDVAGAGVPGHLHWHIVPRWKGDANFMPVVSDTKVISESLESVYQGICSALTPNFKIHTGKKRRKRS